LTYLGLAFVVQIMDNPVFAGITPVKTVIGRYRRRFITLPNVGTKPCTKSTEVLNMLTTTSLLCAREKKFCVNTPVEALIEQSMIKRRKAAQ